MTPPSCGTPTTIFRLDTVTGKSEVFAAPKLTFDPKQFSVEQRFYKSKDGTQIPMFVVMKKGLDRSKGSPTLLYGYGGFNVSQVPGFSPTSPRSCISPRPKRRAMAAYFSTPIFCATV